MPLLDNISIGRYQARDSIIHSLDPRTKGLCVIILMSAVFGITTFFGMAVGLLFILLLILIAKIGLADFSKNIKAFIWLFLLTFLLHLFFSPPGETVTIPVLNIEIGKNGLLNGFFYSFRIAFLLALSYLFMAATSPMEIADGLEKIMMPLRKIGFPAHETALAVSIALRFVPTLLDEARRIRDAQLCRGARLEGGLIWKIKGFASMLIPLFASALRRADTLALTLDARGFRKDVKRSSYIKMSFRRNDLYALAVSFIIAFGLILF